MTKPLWNWDDLVVASGGQADGVPDGIVGGFSIDTRSIQPGDVFVALQDVRDGHDFVPQAFAAGAAAALVSTAYVRKPGDGALLRVDDTLRGLECIGVAARKRLSPSAHVIAVTGSAGKTGTKEMLRASLSAAGRTHAPDKSFNNHWGVPLTLARMPADTEFGVFEIGMNHAGEIRQLTRMVRPHIAIVTNVLPVHVGNFADGEIGVANAKAEIFEGLEPGGTAIILRDSSHYERLSAAAGAIAAGILTFGTMAVSHVALELLPTSGDRAADTVRARLGSAQAGNSISYRLGMPGQHLATNSLAVVATLLALGLEAKLDRLLAPLAGLKPPVGRGERHLLQASNGPLLLIDESYNANPASMRAALEGLVQIADSDVGRRIAVMGDMLELGDKAGEYHLGLLAQAERADLVFACGPNMKLLFDSLPPGKQGRWCATSLELSPDVVAALQPGDAVMVKGSLGSRMAPIVDAIKKRFAVVAH